MAGDEAAQEEQKFPELDRELYIVSPLYAIDVYIKQIALYYQDYKIRQIKEIRVGYNIPEDHHSELPLRNAVGWAGESDPNTGARKKTNLLAVMAAARGSLRDLRQLLETTTPQAKNLTVHKEIEKLERAAEKVQMGIQELVL